MINLHPCMMICNERYWIYPIIREILAVFPEVVVYDTGSTDGTKEIIKENFTNVKLVELDIKDLYEIGELKTEIFKTAGYPVLKIDGDEYYPREVLKYFSELDVASDKAMGFVPQWTVGVRENGNLYRRETKWTDALFFEETTWHNHYPFEGNSLWDSKDKHFRTSEDMVGFHLHHLRRSSKDEETFFRTDKKDWYQPSNDFGDINIKYLIKEDEILKRYNPYYG